MKNEFHKFNSKLFYKLKQKPPENQDASSDEISFTPNCDNIECLIKKLKNRNTKRFDFLKPTMNFFYDLLSDLPNNLNKINPNLSYSQFRVMKSFHKDKPFKILDSD